MMYPRRTATPNHKSQRGIATILVVVLVGLALTATSLGLVHSVRNTQEKRVAVHASTHAQIGAWAGVEAFRSFLGQLDSASLLALNGNLPIAFAGDYGNINANITNVIQNGNTVQIHADITNIHAAAAASTTVGVVYEVELASSGTCTNCIELESVLDFHDDLNVTGNINFTAPAGGVTRISVDGNVNITGTTVTGVSQVYSTGSVSIDSGVSLEEIYSNDDVLLEMSAWADVVRTRGTVVTDGGAGAGTIWANKNITLGGTKDTILANTLESISITAGFDHGEMRAKDDISISNADAVSVLKAKGNIGLTTLNVNIDQAIAEGNMNCPSLSWSKYNTISVNGLAVGCRVDLTNITQGASHNLPVMTEVEPYTMPRFVVDVWTLKDQANYALERDTATGAGRVTVKNVNGIPDGKHYIGLVSGNSREMICSIATNGNCPTGATVYGSLCMGNYKNGSCLTYNSATDTWKFNGSGTAPGVIWVDGNLEMGQGWDYSTILATGNIEVIKSEFRGTSVNYAGYSDVCEAGASQFYDWLKADYQSLFEDQYPTNLCDKTNGEYLPITLGNVALAAGGYNPDDGGTYSGGSIHLAASNRVYGAVLAGGYLTTGGDTYIHGYVTAAVSGTKGAKDNSLGSSTNIDLTQGSEHYNPAQVPDMTDGACPDCDGLGAPAPAAAGANILWSRYR